MQAIRYLWLLTEHWYVYLWYYLSPATLVICTVTKVALLHPMWATPDVTLWHQVAHGDSEVASRSMQCAQASNAVCSYIMQTVRLKVMLVIDWCCFLSQSTCARAGSIVLRKNRKDRSLLCKLILIWFHSLMNSTKKFIVFLHSFHIRDQGSYGICLYDGSIIPGIKSKLVAGSYMKI